MAAFINVGVNTDNVNNGFQQVIHNMTNYTQTIHTTINNVDVDMSRMYNQVNQYNTQIVQRFEQVNNALVDMRTNAVTTNNHLTNVIARQEQQINTQTRIMEGTATRSGQILSVRISRGLSVH